MFLLKRTALEGLSDMIGLYRSRMNSLLPDTASAPSDTGERRVERRRGLEVGSDGDRNSGRRRTTLHRPNSRHCRDPPAYTVRTSFFRTEQKAR